MGRGRSGWRFFFPFSCFFLADAGFNVAPSPSGSTPTYSPWFTHTFLLRCGGASLSSEPVVLEGASDPRDDAVDEPASFLRPAIDTRSSLVFLP